MKILFFIILIIHSAIHLLGFLKGFNLAKITNLKMQIKKHYAIFWLIASVMFLLSAIFQVSNINLWLITLLISIIISQILIVKYWKDAKFGTILNVILFLVLLPSLANLNFEIQTNKEIESFRYDALRSEFSTVKKDISSLPNVVQKWIGKSKILDKGDIKLVELTQTGKMKTERDGEWMDFTAKQYFNIANSSFIWVADVKMNSLIFFRGKDMLKNGIGFMNIKLLSLLDVVNVSNNNKINTGASLRYLGECVWFPCAFIYNNFDFEVITDTSVKVYLTNNGLTVNGVFNFSKNGDFKSFETKRFYGADENSKEELWRIDALDYKEFNGVRIPYKNQVTWKFKDGDFTWLILEVKNIEYYN